LVEKAAQQGLGTLAITDHDTVAGVPEAQQAGVLYGVEILAGVELSVQYQEYADIHILGYLFNPQHASLWTWLERMQQRRMQRGLEILMRVNMCLTQRGQAPLARERVLERAHGALTRPHLAQELLAQGYVSTVEEAFREFLVPCDVPKAGLQPEEAFALVAQAGGVCSLAHPGVLSTDYAVLERLIVLFKAMGLVGVEAYHHAHTPEYMEFFSGLCQTVRPGGNRRLGLPWAPAGGTARRTGAGPTRARPGARRPATGACDAPLGIGLTPVKGLC
jgi:hypothetical protein